MGYAAALLYWTDEGFAGATREKGLFVTTKICEIRAVFGFEVYTAVQ